MRFSDNREPWRTSYYWWGQADVVRPCSEAEWDGNIAINGVAHLLGHGRTDPDNAARIAAELNTRDGYSIEPGKDKL